jgi:peptidoglycan/xylan/chitin deacetylase (PgdA/CDA1 family)
MMCYRRTKTVLRKTAAVLLHYSGILSILLTRRTDRTVILAYHHVLPKRSDLLRFIQPSMYVTVRNFEKHLAFLAKHYTVIPLEDLDRHNDGKRRCAITFDDGWFDSYRYAYPLLRKYDIPATVFVATNLIGTHEWPWPDRMCYYLHNAPRGLLENTLTLLEDEMRRSEEKKGVSFRSFTNKFQLADAVVSFMKSLPVGETDRIAGKIDESMPGLRRRLAEDRPWLNWKEVLEMSEGRISFGAHTHNHRILTRMSTGDAEKEITHSKEVLSRRLGKPVEAFSYPNGGYDEKIVDMVRENGFKLAVTTRKGSANDSESPFTLRRILLHESMTDTIPLFRCRISAVVPLY